MKKSFWVKGTTPWDTFRINSSLILNVLCVLGILYLLCYKTPKTIIAAGKEVSAVSDKRKAERAECFKMEYAGNKFYKFNLEGHEYWYVKEFENNAGFCHSESCHCMTNKVEVAK